jgi:hypothetical protein
MNNTEKKLERFSFKRLSYFTAWLGFTFVPLHFLVSCKASGLLLLFSGCLLILTVIFSIFQKDSNRLRPICLALLALIFNGLLTH